MVGDWIRRSEVARMFNVTPRTVTNWVHEGRLTAYRVFGEGEGKYNRKEVEGILGKAQAKQSEGKLRPQVLDPCPI